MMIKEDTVGNKDKEMCHGRRNYNNRNEPIETVHGPRPLGEVRSQEIAPTGRRTVEIIIIMTMMMIITTTATT